MLVVVIHLGQEERIVLPHNNFGMAVDFFFLLSGFVIAMSYERKLIDHTIRLSEFIKIRLIRLYPMIFFAALLGIAWRLDEARNSIGAIALSSLCAILIIPVPRVGAPGANSYPINGPGWSLTYEILVNILFAACARFLRGAGLWVAFAVMAVMEAAIALRLGRLDFATAWGDQGFAIVRAAAPFLLGVILFRATRQWRPAASDVVPLFGVAALSLLLFAPINNVFYSLVCVFVAFPCLILAGSFQPKSPLLARILKLLGEISYPLYAINQPLARWFGLALGKAGFAPATINPIVELVLLVLLMAGIALAISRLYDVPVRTALRRALAR
jgi:peptidoglycan/LPS O-acetylase OafA/YrhL